jgi:ABC-type multidrug transport system fused ATPase/permease subunit
VLQDTALFDGTIRDNIRFHDPEAPDERVVEAAARAHIIDEILVSLSRWVWTYASPRAAAACRVGNASG